MDDWRPLLDLDGLLEGDVDLERLPADPLERLAGDYVRVPRELGIM
jgi:hypothetical protein